MGKCISKTAKSGEKEIYSLKDDITSGFIANIAMTSANKS